MDGRPQLFVEIRYTQGEPQRAETLARELVQERVDVPVTNVTTTAMAARRATSVIPIVMQTSGYPVEAGLAKSLARPGGNVTGMTIYAGGGALFGKFVELLRELVPSYRKGATYVDKILLAEGTTAHCPQRLLQWLDGLR